ncbi:hypothetical protein [Armatimonas sp.]|uniref:hypothetical protein n=1 Tax=Armatimonas sp. TaxID=1872638 RepID=UPI0037523835
MKSLPLWQRSAIAVAYLVFALMLGQVLLTSLTYNQGYLGYSLDDPYIHLALAKNLAHGHYGLNPGEISAPASSILWPFLLVPGFWLGGALWLPLIWNILAGAGAIWVAGLIVGVALRRAPQERQRLMGIILLVGFVFATNLIGVIFTGMEHTLHLFLSLAALWGLVREREENRAPWWLAIVLALGPLVRYEGLALSLPAIGYLILARRRFSTAGLALVLLFVPLVGFSVYLHSHGMGWLPSSVVAKSRQYLQNTTALERVWFNISSNLWRLEGTQIVVLIALVLQGALRRSTRWLCVWAGCGAILHLIGGRIGWFARYEVYLVAVLLAALALSRSRWLAKTRPLGLVAAALGASALYLQPALETPEATNDIYIQQYQMQRLARMWDGPVAVNDIGWVTLTAEHYVLDLYGLGNLEVLTRSQREPMSVWAQELALRHNVQLVMIYDSWFPPQLLPATWRRVGTLAMDRKAVTSAQNQVALFATTLEAEQRLKALLPEFAKKLPSKALVAYADGTIIPSQSPEPPQLAAR